MPIRIVCPSCSAALSVKDEFAGRAVKCPKCGSVIPPSAQQPAAPAAASPPAPPPAAATPAPQKSPFEGLDEPAKPAKSGPQITGKPVAKGRDEGDEDDRPRRRDRGRDEDDRGRDEDRPRRRDEEAADEDRPRRKDRGDGDRDAREGERKGSKERAAAKGDDRDRDEKGDRPRKRRRDDDDDDDDAPRGKKKGGGSGVMIVAIICGTLLLCCGGVGGSVWYFAYRAKKGIEEFVETTNLRVSKGSYDALQVGSTTRSQAEQPTRLSGGKLATGEDLEKVFGMDADKVDKWMSMVVRQRAVIWRNGDDYIIAAFYPDASADSRLQAKEWRPKVGLPDSAGELSDTEFLRKYPAGKKDPGPKGQGKELTPQTKVPAEDLAREFKTDANAAAEKYVGKTFTVEGKLKDIEVVGTDTRMILEGLPGAGDSRISCLMKGYLKLEPFNHSRGQLMRVEGRCVGGVGGTVSLTDCATTGFDPDRTLEVKVSDLIAAYRTSDTAGDGRFKGKQIRLELAEVEKLDDGSVTLVPFGRIPGSKAPAKKIRVEFDPAYKALYPKLKVGALVRMHGKCEGVRGGEIVVSDAWFGNVLEQMK